jgi:hypothetical protein
MIGIVFAFQSTNLLVVCTHEQNSVVLHDVCGYLPNSTTLGNEIIIIIEQTQV